MPPSLITPPNESCFLPLTFTALTPDKSFAFQTHCLQKEFSDYKGTVCPRELINLRNQIFPFGPNLYREQSTARACASTMSAEMKTQLSLGHHHHLLIWPEYFHVRNSRWTFLRQKDGIPWSLTLYLFWCYNSIKEQIPFFPHECS